MDWQRLRVIRERLIETALLPELTEQEAAMGLTSEDVTAFQRADVERTRAWVIARRAQQE